MREDAYASEWLAAAVDYSSSDPSRFGKHHRPSIDDTATWNVNLESRAAQECVARKDSLGAGRHTLQCEEAGNV
jgi:hypothetical protein